MVQKINFNPNNTIENRNLNYSVLFVVTGKFLAELKKDKSLRKMVNKITRNLSQVKVTPVTRGLSTPGIMIFSWLKAVQIEFFFWYYHRA